MKTLGTTTFDNSTQWILNKRAEHEEIKNELIEFYNSTSQAAFESSDVIRDMLEELEDLTDKIVNRERFKRR